MGRELNRRGLQEGVGLKRGRGLRGAQHEGVWLKRGWAEPKRWGGNGIGRDWRGRGLMVEAGLKSSGGS